MSPANEQEDRWRRLAVLPRNRLRAEFVQIDAVTRNQRRALRSDQSQVDKKIAVIGVLEEDRFRQAKGPCIKEPHEPCEPGLLDEGSSEPGDVVDDRDAEKVRGKGAIDIGLDRVAEERGLAAGGAAGGDSGEDSRQSLTGDFPLLSIGRATERQPS